MKDIHSAGQYLLGPVNDCLDFAKAQANKLQLYLMPCALTPLLNHVCMLVAPQCTQKQIQLCV